VLPSLRSVPVIAIAVLMVAGCAAVPEPQQVAERFIESYYVKSDLAAALALCAGDARTRLQAELAAVQGVPRDPADTPRVSFALARDPIRSATAAAYAYRVKAHTADVGVVVATLGLTHEGGRWLVTALDERESTPAS
jgi:hypothetical protein